MAVIFLFFFCSLARAAGEFLEKKLTSDKFLFIFAERKLRDMLFYTLFYIFYFFYIGSVKYRAESEGGFFAPNLKDGNGKVSIGKVLSHYLVYLPLTLILTAIAVFPIVGIVLALIEPR